MDNVAAVSAGVSYATAIKTDGSLWMCGDNWINPSSNVPIKVLENVALGNSVLQKALSYEVKNNIKVLLNNKQITFGQSSIIKDGQILVPAKEIFESMGAVVLWNGAAQTITATKGDVSIIMQMGLNIISRNGLQSMLAVPPMIINGKAFVPAKEVADALSSSFDWNENNQTVDIGTLDTKPLNPYVKYEEKMKTYGFDKMYNNKRAETSEPVTKAEALKLALAAVFNTYDLSGFANVDKYPYILASVDKSIYEKPFMPGIYADELSPRELYTYKKDLYPQVESWCEEFFNAILNIDYRTITEEGLREKIEPYLILNANDFAISSYVKHVKDNEIVIVGSSQLQFPIIYFDGTSYRPRLRLKFEVKHSKTKESLLYLDMIDGLKETYENRSYQIVQKQMLLLLMQMISFFCNIYTQKVFRNCPHITFIGKSIAIERLL